MEGPWLTSRNQSRDAVEGLLQSLSGDSNYDKRGSWTYGQWEFEDMLGMGLCPIDQPSSDTVHKQCSQTLKSFITIGKQTTIDNEANFTHSRTLL